MEKLLKKDVTFQWSEGCQKNLDVLKEKMIIAPILVFPDWKKEFHVHVDGSCIALGVVLAQLGPRETNHPITFATIKLFKAENNYSAIEREGLDMVYALQKFRHYLLRVHFKMFTDHSALKHLVNKSNLGRKICQWLLLFQEYDLEVIVNPGILNFECDHLSRIETGEEAINIKVNMPDAQLLTI